MRNPKRLAKFPKSTQVAAVLAASLTTAALAHASRAEGDPLKVETTLHALASIAASIGGGAVEAGALARSTEEPGRKRRDARVFLASDPLGGDRHLWLEPFVGHVYAKDIEATFAQVAPERVETWAQNRRAFDRKLDDAIFGKELCDLLGGGARLEKLHHEGKLDEFLAQQHFKGRPLGDQLGGLVEKAKPLRGAKLVAHHEWWGSYADTWGCEFLGYLEPEPGLKPSASHLEELEAKARESGAKLVLTLSHEPRSTAVEFASRFGGKAVVLPSDVGALGTRDWFDFQETLVTRAVEALGA
jgi:ABC-type Zn uptake system ZnuABC Zn-binding protein ZnuA